MKEAESIAWPSRETARPWPVASCRRRIPGGREPSRSGTSPAVGSCGHSAATRPGYPGRPSPPMARHSPPAAEMGPCGSGTWTPATTPAGSRATPVRLWSIIYSPDGRTLAFGGEYTLKLWDVAGNRLRAAPEPDGFWVQSVTFARDGKALAAAGVVVDAKGHVGEGQVRLYDLAQNPPVRRAKLSLDLSLPGRAQSREFLVQRRRIQARRPRGCRGRDDDDRDLGRDDRGRARLSRPDKWWLRRSCRLYARRPMAGRHGTDPAECESVRRRPECAMR